MAAVHVAAGSLLKMKLEIDKSFAIQAFYGKTSIISSSTDIYNFCHETVKFLVSHCSYFLKLSKLSQIKWLLCMLQLAALHQYIR